MVYFFSRLRRAASTQRQLLPTALSVDCVRRGAACVHYTRYYYTTMGMWWGYYKQSAGTSRARRAGAARARHTWSTAVRKFRACRRCFEDEVADTPTVLALDAAVSLAPPPAPFRPLRRSFAGTSYRPASSEATALGIIACLLLQGVFVDEHERSR